MIREDFWSLDCKTVRLFAYSSTREQSNKRSRTRLKTETQTGERRFFLSPHMPYGRISLAHFTRVRLLRHALPISLLILRKKTDCFAVYLITYSLNDFHSGYVVSFCIVSLVFKLLFSSRIMYILDHCFSVSPFVLSTCGVFCNWKLSTSITGETSGLSAPNAFRGMLPKKKIWKSSQTVGNAISSIRWIELN